MAAVTWQKEPKDESRIRHRPFGKLDKFLKGHKARKIKRMVRLKDIDGKQFSKIEKLDPERLDKVASMHKDWNKKGWDCTDIPTTSPEVME